MITSYVKAKQCNTKLTKNCQEQIHLNSCIASIQRTFGIQPSYYIALKSCNSKSTWYHINPGISYLQMIHSIDCIDWQVRKQTTRKLIEFLMLNGKTGFMNSFSSTLTSVLFHSWITCWLCNSKRINMS